MRTAISTSGLLLALAASSAAQGLRRAACNADNCARLVTGTRAGLPASRLADCSSFVGATTITPSPVYTTVTVTPTQTNSITNIQTQTDTITATTTTTEVDTTVTITTTTDVSTVTVSDVVIVRGFTPVKRAVTSPTVPSYATASCPNASRYSSACSCAGVTPGTVIAPASTVTSTITGPAITQVITISTTITVQTTTTTDTTTTSTIVVATTSTVPATTTVTAPGPTKTGYACGANVQGNGIYSFRRYRVNCGQRVTGGQVAFIANYSDQPQCLRICNSIKYCVYAEYFFRDGTCNLYYTPPTAIVDDAKVDALILV